MVQLVSLYRRVKNLFFPNVKIKRIVNNEKISKKKRIAIFSHYDKDGLVDDYVVFYLRKLEVFSDIVFVTTSEHIISTEIEKVHFCRTIIVTENRGYDFGAWKTGMDVINLHHRTSDYEELILCNDSVYGPLYDLNEIFDSVKKYDIFSITDSYEIMYHLQSFFVVYKKTVWNHPYFKTFWSKYYFYERKYKLIINNEIKYMNKLLSCGFTFSSFCTVQKNQGPNPMQIEWKYLIEKGKCPFIKRELLLKNPLRVNILEWEVVVEATGYPVNLIVNHLRRF